MRPGVARLMLEVSNRVSRGYHAAKAKNARLARFQLSEGSKVMRLCAVVQPRYVEAIDSCMADHVNVIRDLIDVQGVGSHRARLGGDDQGDQPLA